MVVLYGCFVETYINTLIYAFGLMVTLTHTLVGSLSTSNPSPSTLLSLLFDFFASLMAQSSQMVPLKAFSAL